MNKIFIENLVGRIWGSNLSQNSIHTMTNVCKIFRPRVRVNKTGVPKTKCPGFSYLYLLFVICLWTCVLSRVQTTHESSCVNFSTQFFNTEQNCRKYGEISQILLEDGLGFFTKFQKNIFLKFHVKIWTEFGTMRHISRQTDEYSPWKKSNIFTRKRTFISTLEVMNKKFIENLVGRIWCSNLSQNSIHIMTNVW